MGGPSRQVVVLVALYGILAVAFAATWAVSGDPPVGQFVGPLVTAMVVWGIISLLNRSDRPRFTTPQWFVIVMYVIPPGLVAVFLIGAAVVSAASADWTWAGSLVAVGVALGGLAWLGWRRVRILGQRPQ